MAVCRWCEQEKTDDEMEVSRHGRPSNVTCKSCRHKRQAKWKKDHPEVRLAQWARHRARAYGLPCDLNHDDFEIPSHCPVLGIPMSLGDGKLHDASPTLDRIIPEVGYVKGNIAVISYKANRMKSNASLEELERLTMWLRRQQSLVEACVPAPSALDVGPASL